jgi:very-short-patch-repair endonuclease
MKFTCMECGREFGQITGKHVRTHGIETVAEYLEKHPGAATVRERKDSAETIERKRLARTGKKHSEEAKARIGAGNRGKKMSAEAIDKWRKSYAKYIEENGSPLVGRDRGEDFRRKMSEIAKNRPREMVDAKVVLMLEARRGSKATPEQRERYSAARIKYMLENPDKLGPKKLFNTRPELEFEKELQQRSVPYRKNVPIGGYLYDFLINDDLIVEIDGPYHYDMNLYGSKSDPESLKLEGLAKTQAKDLKKDIKAKDLGYNLYRIKVGGKLPDDWYQQLLDQKWFYF